MYRGVFSIGAALRDSVTEPLSIVTTKAHNLSDIKRTVIVGARCDGYSISEKEVRGDLLKFTGRPHVLNP